MAGFTQLENDIRFAITTLSALRTLGAKCYAMLDATELYTEAGASIWLANDEMKWCLDYWSSNGFAGELPIDNPLSLMDARATNKFMQDVIDALDAHHEAIVNDIAAPAPKKRGKTQVDKLQALAMSNPKIAHFEPIVVRQYQKYWVFFLGRNMALFNNFADAQKAIANTSKGVNFDLLDFASKGVKLNDTMRVVGRHIMKGVDAMRPREARITG